ncbi:MAG: carbohydrate ABC transporter permease [Spirochaetaceae bacterium]|nr:MAG: carbohydrate ABC transporter permease [Spirochaetaceae bacterium]
MVKQRSPWLKAIVLLLLILGAFVSIVPFLFMLSHSLKTIAETITRSSAIPFDPKFWPRVPQWSNYRVAWQEARFGLYFRNSVVITAITVGGIAVTSSLAAYAFAKLRFVGRDLIFSILLATLMIPQTVLLIPNFIIVARLGWIDRLPALTVPFLASAFHIFLLRQFFSQIPNELIEVAKIDGATHLRSLVSIVLPLSKAPIFTVVFLSFIYTWNLLQWPLVVTQTPRWRPITVGLSVFITEAGPETHLRMAGAVIAVLPVITVYFIAQRQFTEAITRSGIKE